MNEELRDRLLGEIRAAGQSRPVKLETPSSVEAGQVRRLRAYDDDLESILALLLHVDEEGGFATVVSVVSPKDEATVRDLVIDRASTGLPFDLVLRVDGVSTAWNTQLSGTPVVTSLPRPVTELARRGPRLSNDELATEAAALGIGSGELIPQAGDHLWWEIGRGAEHLARLTASCHEGLVKPPIVDPAILPSLLSNEDKADWAEAMAVIDAISSDRAELPPEAWDSCEEVLAQNHYRVVLAPETVTRDPDSWRLVERRFLEAALRCPAAVAPSQSEPIGGPVVGPERDIPMGLTQDPLKRLVARAAQAGERSTRIVTIDRLWREEGSVFHTTVGGHRHAIIAEFDLLEEVYA
ncbi:hypothetical protein MSS4_03388 [Mycobacterium marinum]|uniref:hypothetical protein n=1 Tax=Mycobacterium marinum TaxID=1781 RepID=UPI000EECCC01|nr:hypothetical protein [Mycobacterium marinum]RFZ47390.1 hypothetical protein MSS4_03388 [Mycobacterium marinum]